MTSQHCPSEVELLEFVDAALSPEQLERVSQHVRGCAACEGQVLALREIVGDLSAALPSPARVEQAEDLAAHVQAVMGRLDAPPSVSELRSPPTQKWWLWGAGLAAAAGLLLLLAPLSRNIEPDVAEWTARGGSSGPSLSRDVGVQLYAAGPTLRALQPGSPIRAKTALTAGLRNLSEHPAFLLLFGVDSKQTVHWIAPEFTVEGSDPEAVRVAPSTKEQLLHSAVVFEDLAPGPLRIVTLLALQPMRVSEVEHLPAEQLSGDHLIERFPKAEIRQIVVHVTR